MSLLLILFLAGDMYNCQYSPVLIFQVIKLDHSFLCWTSINSMFFFADRSFLASSPTLKIPDWPLPTTVPLLLYPEDFEFPRHTEHESFHIFSRRAFVSFFNVTIHIDNDTLQVFFIPEFNHSKPMFLKHTSALD